VKLNGQASLTALQIGKPPLQMTRAQCRTAAARNNSRLIGKPEDLDVANELALNEVNGFQRRILPLIGARALGAEKG